MTDIAKGMAAEYENSFLSEKGSAHTREDAIRAALLWAANQAEAEFDAGATSPDVARWLRRAAGRP